MKEGIDASHHNGVVDWEAVSRAGKVFAIAKATEGRTIQDSKFSANWKGMGDVGMQRGVYHFLRFGTSTPKQQMDNLFNQLKDAYTSKDIIALDVEEASRTPSYETVADTTEECVNLIKERAGFYPYIYTMTSFWDKYVKDTPSVVRECPLWIARWRGRQPSPQELPKGWGEWKIWQYSDKGSVAGIRGHVDLNKMAP